VTVTVDMSEVVLVSGTPQLQLTIGGTVVQANYLGGSGTNQLSFTYTIQAGQTDANGIAIAANALQLNGGTIQDAAGHDAVLTHVAVADNANYLVDTASPAVNQVAITSATSAQNNTLTGGDVLTVTVDMSEVVQVSGTPQLALTIGGAVVQANYLGGSGTNQLSFSYTIQANQMDANGVAIAANALQLNGGTIQDVAGNNAVLTHVAVADNANYMVDTASPGVIQVAITSATNAQNNTLNVGDVVTVTVNMSEVVQVSGSPQLALTIGGAVVQANYASGSGTNQLSFTYTIQAGQTDANGIAIAANALQFNGGTIQDVAGNNAVLTHLAVADSANYLVDTASPAVNQVAITSATGAQNNTLTVGDVVTVTVDMTEVVQVSGTPQLQLTIGGALVQANYLGGSGTNQLSFTYTIQAGQTDANGIAIATNALQLNGGTIQDAAGNNAVLTHAAVADNANYLVDTASPGVSQMLIDVETGEGDIVHVTVNFTEAVSVSGTPQLAVKLGDVIVQATYDAQATALSGSGSSLVFSYLITGGQTYHNGIEIAANSLQLNGGSISDAAGNNAVLTHAAPISTWIDDGVPSITQVAITSATGAQNSTLNAGDVLTVKVDMSEVVLVSGTPQLALTIGGAVVQANYASGSGTNQLSFTYTIQAGQTDANGIAIAANALQLNGGTIHDAVGNNATNTSLMHLAVADNSSYKVDTTAPSIFTTALTLTGDTFASVESNELGTAYLVRNDVIVTSLADITTASDTLWNSVPISAANTGTFLATTGLSDGTYKVYAVDAAGNLAQALNSVTIVSSAITASPVQLSAIAGGTGGFVINGQAASDWSGLSVSGAGDVNGDGLADLIISADNADPGGRIDAGKTYVVFGKGTGTAVNLSAVEAGTGGFVINGQTAGDWSAYSVSGAGDVNGDGLADLIVGAIDADPGGRTDAGKTYVVFGKSTGTAINLSAVEAGTGGFVINGQGE
jgi:heat shock protein HslJ